METVANLLSPSRPTHEVADIFRQYGAAYCATHRLSPEQRQVFRAIEQCRTAALGGHVDECDQCGALRISYNSCRNRHCPKCGALAKARWLEARQAELLPIPYFHVVFTLDHIFNPLVGWNQAFLYDLLFHSAAETLQAFAAHYLGGEVGLVAVLHTWGQDLGQHVHLHCIVTGGALTPDGRRWVNSQPGFLFPVKPLSQAFRECFLAGLERACRRQQLVFGGACADWQTAERFTQVLAESRAKSWEVYLHETAGGPEAVFDYLGRYIHRVAISNHRIVGIAAGQVRFTYRDHRSGGQRKVLSLPVEEFIRRFLLHVLPTGFVRIRYYGLWNQRGREGKLARCRELLGAASPLAVKTAEPDAALLARLTGIDLSRCPLCGVGRMARKQELTPAAAPSPLAVFVAARREAVTVGVNDG